jgi:phosphomevalonate kinase
MEETEDHLPVAGIPHGDDAASVNITPSNNLVLRSILDYLKNVKEALLIVGFFGGLSVWVINYFATQERLDQLACETKVNTRMLQAKEFVDSTEGHAIEVRSELRDQNRVLQRLQSEAGAKENPSRLESLQEDIAAVKARIDSLESQAKAFQTSEDQELRISRKGLDALTQNACLIKEQRELVVKQLASGDF